LPSSEVGNGEVGNSKMGNSEMGNGEVACHRPQVLGATTWKLRAP